MSSKFGTARKIILGLGIGFAIVTVASGLSGWVFSKGQVDHSLKQREVFTGIPAALVVAFYIVVPVMLVYGAVLFAQRTKNWERGRPDNRATTPKNASTPAARLPGRRLHADPAARPGGRRHALAHLLQLPGPAGRDHGAARSTTSSPTSLKFLHGDVYAGYKVVGQRRRAGLVRSGWCGPSCAATCSGRTASASRPSPSTR